MKFTEHQWVARRMLLCDGDRGFIHAAAIPRMSSDGGVTSTDIRCEECGSLMVLVDVLTVDPAPTLSTLAYQRDRAPMYTTAKLNPVAMIVSSDDA